MNQNNSESRNSPADTVRPHPQCADSPVHDSRNSKVVAIIQARLGSTRLPQKILLDIAGQSMLERVVSRVQKASLIDEVVIATTDSDADQRLVQYCKDRNWNYYCGSEDDVLSRYVETAQVFSASRIVRVTSDCPLIDPDIIDELLRLSSLGSVDSDLDYCCNFYPVRRYPRGLDCESISTLALNRIDQLARNREYREHVTLYAYRNPAEFSIGSLSCSTDCSEFRWTVDTPQDLELVRTIYRHFESTGDHDFGWRQAFAACQANPEWQKINQLVVQKAA